MKVVVVGGVAAGMSAAARLRRLDENAEIVVFERDEYVSFANCGLPYHIGGEISERESLLVVTPERLEQQLNISVRTCHEVTKIDRGRRVVHVFDRRGERTFQESWDKLILALGAVPLRLPLPGIEHPKIFTLRNIADMDAIKRTVDRGASTAIVVGGGYIGVEIAEAFENRGLKVYLVELLDEILPPLDHEMDRALIFHMESHGVSLLLGQRAESFHVRLGSGKAVRGDLVVLAMGVRSESSLARQAGLEVGDRGGLKVDQHMRTSDPNIYAAGDMVEVTDTVTGEQAIVALAGPANRQGRIAADHICGRSSAYTSTQGTSVVKVFKMTAGGTGATEKTLQRTGLPYKKVYVHHNGHASYYPGTHPLHLKLLFAPEDGKILGAQVVGVDGVDKRIDVMAVALRTGMTVFDLEHLELAYAPPYGSAKDPANMAGFVAANLLRDDLEQWYAEDYPARTDGGRIIDVRSPQEYKEWHIEKAINIPIADLRQRLNELDRNKAAYVYCKSGFRGYLAYRILKQCGFSKAKNLSGGLQTFLFYHHICVGCPETEIPLITYAEDREALEVVASKMSASGT
jgi:NADPH-dependent 2,4-dienoyl-CoA reductase/sulfur reductase-like enzyme/rhodanese-related sulfurtransferase